MTPGFTTHESSHGRRQKRTLNTPVSPWEISDTYSGLQMSAILMNTPKINTPVSPWESSDTYSGLPMSAILMSTPKIWFLEIKFLKITLKSQHSLAGVELQNRQEIDLLIPEQRGT